jgi:hypothetical protein
VSEKATCRCLRCNAAYNLALDEAKQAVLDEAGGFSYVSPGLATTAIEKLRRT